MTFAIAWTVSGRRTMVFGYLKNAPDLIRDLAREEGEPVAYVATQFSQHDLKMLGDAALGIAQRIDDREFRKMDLELEGHELYAMRGFEAVGAQFAQAFHIMLAAPI
ncbi:hypothetical protein [Bosea sp. BH3]|uniref:hypothetical protein n=1 Tax=Bosea sp. BH3 TaxID=2871701 RepID=UPI0021CB77F7|nr:hypothetical protein [Bosea sp. BH3]MCU4181780.1 hypothetical protein [Bosea sp. BH3]